MKLLHTHTRVHVVQYVYKCIMYIRGCVKQRTIAFLKLYVRHGDRKRLCRCLQIRAPAAAYRRGSDARARKSGFMRSCVHIDARGCTGIQSKWTYINGDTGQREHEDGRLLLRYVAVELVAVLVPLDGVEDHVVEIEAALEPHVLTAHHVLRYHELHHSQALDPCNHKFEKKKFERLCL